MSKAFVSNNLALIYETLADLWRIATFKKSWGLVSGVQDLGFGVWGLGFGIWDQGYLIWCLRSAIWDLWFGV